MCRQDIPHRSFWTRDELQRFYDGLLAKFGTPEATRRFGKLFVAFGYRWLAPHEPDPNGFHQERLAAACRLYLQNTSRCAAPAAAPSLPRLHPRLATHSSTGVRALLIASDCS